VRHVSLDLVAPTFLLQCGGRVNSILGISGTCRAVCFACSAITVAVDLHVERVDALNLWQLVLELHCCKALCCGPFHIHQGTPQDLLHVECSGHGVVVVDMCAGSFTTIKGSSLVLYV